MMNEAILKRPDLKIVKTGKTFKVFEVTGDSGYVMPRHLSSKEAVIIVQEGDAMLEIEGEINYLTKNDVFVIPSVAVHILSIKNKFKAIVIMELDSQIEFIN